VHGVHTESIFYRFSPPERVLRDFFFVSYYVASHGPADFMKIEGTSIFSVALPIALFGGVTAYGIHRSLLFGWIELWFDSKCGKACRRRVPLISTSTIETLLWRWGQPVKQADFDREVLNEHFNKWADFIHLQYTSTLCIGLGALTGVIVIPGKHSAFCPLIVLAVLLFLAAFASNWRTYSVLDYVRRGPNKVVQRTGA
jgi:hypothetical protein